MLIMPMPYEEHIQIYYKTNDYQRVEGPWVCGLENIHADRTKFQNRIGNPSFKAEWEVQDPKQLEKTKIQHMLGEPSSKTEVQNIKTPRTPKIPKSKSPKWIAALLLPLRLLLRGSATATATGTATSTATTTATVLLHATTQTRGAPRLASTKRPFQKRFNRKLYSVAWSWRGPHFLSGKPWHIVEEGWRRQVSVSCVQFAITMLPG